jgi:hypothetical protein
MLYICTLCIRALYGSVINEFIKYDFFKFEFIEMCASEPVKLPF